MTTFEDLTRDFVIEATNILMPHLQTALERDEDDCEFLTLSNICHNIEINGYEIIYEFTDVETIEFKFEIYHKNDFHKLKIAILDVISDINYKYGYDYCLKCGHKIDTYFACDNCRDIYKDDYQIID